MKFTEETIDITDEVATWSTKDLGNLLLFLHRNGFERTFFDGYNASIEVIRERKKAEE